jgi:AmmeMemoRadiSam system protein B
MTIRKAAVAGTWYPGTSDRLAAEVDLYLGDAQPTWEGDLTALIAPHAGLRYSGPVAAYAYKLLAGRHYDVVVLVGPSHYVGFEGVAVCQRGAFETPLGPVSIAESWADAIARAAPSVHEHPTAHTREHSLEMQLPFLQRVLPDTPIVPLVMGYQTRDTIDDLARGLSSAMSGRAVLLVASTDLSHYYDAATAARLDSRVIEHVTMFDATGLQNALDAFPQHACGGGPAVSVMQAARSLGAQHARVLKYADSGDVSGDKDAVVGYLAAAFGNLSSHP